MSESDHMETFCNKSSGNFILNSTYHTNLNAHLSALSNQSSLAKYYNLTTGLASDTVHGMFLCTGDVNRTTCNSCVKTATIEIAKNCTNNRELMIRYSDKFFLLTLETQPNTSWRSTDLIPKTFGKFKERLSDKMGEVIVRSSMLSSSFTPYYLMDTTRYDNLYDLESIVQCTSYLDPGNCSTCLKLALQEIIECCSDNRWAMIWTPKCLVSFDTYDSSLPPLPPPTRSGCNKLGGMVLAVAASVLAFLL
ncbi:unnamed protein product [Eruca vesicaria subsp. sativa]|uniref:Gnk2-homologous domain-containing protein n=1 Tax=Eruca vesicaria subsp. sativa TaxID=29727 RepID=A0ABC8LEP6_ERUVS|nr:unnamed protein product [Eruca vesicaria subsp. sativa]